MAKRVRVFRIATYNIRKCVGLDWRRRPERIIQVIAEMNADIVALQEADKRLGARHATLPVAALSDRTGLRAVTLPGESPSSGHHGNAILVRDGTEVLEVTALDLPSLEPRGALIADLKVHGQALRVAAVHLGLRPADRRRQAEAVAGALTGLAAGRPTVLLGDLNEWSAQGPAIASLSANFEASAPLRSFHTALPVAPLDRIFVGHGLRFRHVGLHRSAAALRASDHLPLFADIDLVHAEADRAQIRDAGETRT